MDTSLRGATATRQSRATSETLDCFVAEPVIGPAQESRTRWLLAMTSDAILKIESEDAPASSRRRPGLQGLLRRLLQWGCAREDHLDAGAAAGLGVEIEPATEPVGDNAV